MNGKELITSLISGSGLYGLTAEKFSRGRSNEDVVRQMLEAGMRIIQYREKTKKMGVKYAECQILRQMTRKYGAAFIVNDDVQLARIGRLNSAIRCECPQHLANLLEFIVMANK